MAKMDVLGGRHAVARFLPPDHEALAAEHRQVETKFGNAKIADADTLLRFIFLHAGADLPLRQTVAVMDETALPSISPLRLHKKLGRAVPYLRSLVERMVTWPTEGAAERWGGFVFSAVDATVVCGPGAVGTDARIHTKLRVADVSLDEIQVTDEFGGETLRRFAWHPGELAVADRAYFTAAGIRHVLDAGATLAEIPASLPDLDRRRRSCSLVARPGRCRVAPEDFSPGALTRTGQGDFHHPAPPLGCLAATSPRSGP